MAAPGGGWLAGAVGFSGAAADVPDEKLRLRVANAAWARWTPVNFVGIAAHLVGGVGAAGEQRSASDRMRDGDLGHRGELGPECRGGGHGEFRGGCTMRARQNDARLGGDEQPGRDVPQLRVDQ